MRTPIAAIEGYLSLALNPKVANIDARGRNLLEKAHAATEHLSQLFVDLLTSAKAEDGRLASYPKVIELGEVIEQITDATRFTAEKKGLGLKYVLSSGTDIRGGKVVRPLFYVYVDTNRIREVLQNLVDNAVKYTNEGSVTITLTGDSTVVQVQIKDSGIGIAEEDIPHLFQKFYRVDNSMTRTVGGTGLGLFICKKIIELYNGRIWVDSRAGQGSTFFINLPRLTTEQALHMQQSEASTLSPLDNP
jgi:signal transduction histidine kinase